MGGGEEKPKPPAGYTHTDSSQEALLLLLLALGEDFPASQSSASEQLSSSASPKWHPGNYSASVNSSQGPLTNQVLQHLLFPQGVTHIAQVTVTNVSLIFF